MCLPGPPSNPENVQSKSRGEMGLGISLTLKNLYTKERMDVVLGLFQTLGPRRIDVGLGPSITLKNVGTKERKNVEPRLFLNTEDAWDQ